MTFLYNLILVIDFTRHCLRVNSTYTYCVKSDILNLLIFTRIASKVILIISYWLKV